MKQVSIYLIEDQLIYRKALEKFIHSLTVLDQRLLFTIVSVKNLLSYYKEMDFLKIADNDIFLIDIDLQTSFSGIDLAKQIRNKNKHCFILFLTNLDNQAVEIINQKLNATSYLLKGSSLNKQQLKGQLLSVKKDIEQRLHNQEKYITFKRAGETVYIPYKDILYIQSTIGVRNMLLVKTTYAEQIIDGTINKVKKEMQSVFFYLKLRSFIINLRRIASLNYLLGLVTFDDGSELEVGEKIVYKLKKAL